MVIAGRLNGAAVLPILVAGGIAVGAAALFAPFAVADSDTLDGVYMTTVIDSSIEDNIGDTGTVTFTPCGPDCVHWYMSGNPGHPGFNLYRQGAVWVRSPEDGALVVIDAVSLKVTAAGTASIDWHKKWQLTKIG